jgi:hypothetical protein
LVGLVVGAGAAFVVGALGVAVVCWVVGVWFVCDWFWVVPWPELYHHGVGGVVVVVWVFVGWYCVQGQYWWHGQ